MASQQTVPTDINPPEFKAGLLIQCNSSRIVKGLRPIRGLQHIKILRCVPQPRTMKNASTVFYQVRCCRSYIFSLRTAELFCYFEMPYITSHFTYLFSYHP